jgi:HEAT repeats
MADSGSRLPAKLVWEACQRWGEPVVAIRCAAMLRDPSAMDWELLPMLGGHRSYALTPAGEPSYWIAVWAARGLLHVWHPSAAPAVVAALGHEAWRVREMSAKVCLRREIGEACDALALLAGDPVPRVRAAVARALGAIGEAEHAQPLRNLRDDEDASVRLRASQALRLLSIRLDRNLDT